MHFHPQLPMEGRGRAQDSLALHVEKAVGCPALPCPRASVAAPVFDLGCLIGWSSRAPDLRPLAESVSTVAWVGVGRGMEEWTSLLPVYPALCLEQHRQPQLFLALAFMLTLTSDWVGTSRPEMELGR